MSVIVFNQGIDLDNIRITLIPMPDQLYVYKTSIESTGVDNVSVSATTSSLSSFIIRVSTIENNLTTYSLLVGCDSVFYNNFIIHCVTAF